MSRIGQHVNLLLSWPGTRVQCPRPSISTITPVNSHIYHIPTRICRVYFSSFFMFTMEGHDKCRGFSLPEYTGRVAVEMDRESNGSSAEEMESPPSVKGRSYRVRGHSQIMRIREEDSCLGEDKFGFVHFVLYSRPMLPASPLGGRTGD